jgi:tRNA threonylcarbamoyladenosine biosynthesis protein TsaB
VNLRAYKCVSGVNMGNVVKNPVILLVETSSRTGSLAIALGQKIVNQITFSGAMKHSIELFPAMNRLLEQVERKPYQIEQVYISAGPGSFTGLRIAVTLAKMMSFTCEAKIVAVDTLDVIVENVNDYLMKDTQKEQIDRIATILDAKRGQFFVAIYQIQHNDDSMQAEGDVKFNKIVPDCVISAADFINNYVKGKKPIWLLGDGLVYHQDKFSVEGVNFLDRKYWSPQAVKVHQLGWNKAVNGEFQDPITLAPLYLCRPQVTIKT